MIELAAYELVLVLDTQIILEGKPLETLPWEELGAGSILLVCTPTMLSEVDGKKRDGRIGERARHFNRLVEPCVGTAGVTTLREGTPTVQLALVAHGAIDWSKLDDLDRDAGDDRVVAEALFAKVSDPTRLTIFSYDLRPRSAAIRQGLSAMKPPESWIYEPEPSPAQKDITRLKQRIRELETTQPAVECDLGIDVELPLRLVRVRPLSSAEQEALAEDILSGSPQRGHRPLEMLPDYSYASRYKEFEEKAKAYGRKLPAALERLFNQLSFRLRFGVVGSIGANHIDVQLRATNGRLHDKLVLSDVFRPSPPRYQPGPNSLYGYNGPTIADLMHKTARHEVGFDPKPCRESYLRLACEDFRHGRSYEHRLYAELDPHGANPAELHLAITAANLTGTVEHTLSIPFEVEDVEAGELLNLSDDRLVRNYRLQDLFEELVDAEEYDELEG